MNRTSRCGRASRTSIHSSSRSSSRATRGSHRRRCGARSICSRCVTVLEFRAVMQPMLDAAGGAEWPGRRSRSVRSSRVARELVDQEPSPSSRSPAAQRAVAATRRDHEPRSRGRAVVGMLPLLQVTPRGLWTSNGRAQLANGSPGSASRSAEAERRPVRRALPARVRPGRVRGPHRVVAAAGSASGAREAASEAADVPRRERPRALRRRGRPVARSGHPRARPLLPRVRQPLPRTQGPLAGERPELPRDDVPDAAPGRARSRWMGSSRASGRSRRTRTCPRSPVPGLKLSRAARAELADEGAGLLRFCRSRNDPRRPDRRRVLQPHGGRGLRRLRWRA